jgi:hypothetical protein
MAGLLKLSNAKLNVVPDVQLAIPTTLITSGESFPMPLLNPKHLGVCVLPLIVPNEAER